MNRVEISKLFEKIKNSHHCVALTGAGVSTLSGIRDFRGKNGLYNEIDAEKMFDIEYFERDPSLYYKMAGSFIYNIDDIPASIVHTTLAKLEQKGALKAVITQNIDLLHQKGGSKHVIEVHGSPALHYCLRCPGIRVPFAEAAKIVKNGEMPKCPKCGRVLKPAITFFGESLPRNALNEACRESADADLMLILGSSLSVYPAAGLPNETLRAGGEIIIINNMPTPLDSLAALHFDELQDTFEGLDAILEQN